MPRLTPVQRALADRYIPLALRLASKRADKSPGIDPDDLRQVALEALCEAAGRYDPDRGCLFGQFAGPGILGALSDYVRETYDDVLRSAGELALVADTTSSDDSLRAVAELIETAPAKYQEALRLTFVEQWNQVEIALLFGVTQPYVHKLLREGLMCIAGVTVVPFRARPKPRRARHA